MVPQNKISVTEVVCVTAIIFILFANTSYLYSKLRRGETDHKPAAHDAAQQMFSLLQRQYQLAVMPAGTCITQKTESGERFCTTSFLAPNERWYNVFATCIPGKKCVVVDIDTLQAE